MITVDRRANENFHDFSILQFLVNGIEKEIEYRQKTVLNLEETTTENPEKPEHEKANTNL
jgi:hypothetical protein